MVVFCDGVSLEVQQYVQVNAIRVSVVVPRKYFSIFEFLHKVCHLVYRIARKAPCFSYGDIRVSRSDKEEILKTN